MTAHAPSMPAVQDLVPGVSKGKFAMWLFLISDAMSFLGILSAYLATRSDFPKSLAYPPGQSWSPEGWFGTAGVMLAAGMTFVLIISSMTMVLGLLQYQRGNFAKGQRLLLITAGVGCLFLLGQVYEWHHLLTFVDTKSGLNLGHYKTAPSSNQAAIFYCATGFHGMHVLGGVILLALTAVMGKLGHKRWLEPNTIEVVGLYWHFVDLVWVLIFTFIYLI